MARYYIDTCIWRDYYENRTDKFRPLGEWAFRLLRQINNNAEPILITEVLRNELMVEYDKDQSERILSIANIIIEIVISHKQRVESRRISNERNLPIGDVLHAIIARDNEAIIVTRDQHFEQLTDMSIIRKPEELL